MVVFCSIVTPGTEAQARVLAASVRRHEPDARLIARLRGADGDASGWDEVVEADSAPTIPELLAFALAGAEAAVYVDPEICLYDSLEPIWSAVGEGGVALFPRLSALPEDGKRPDHGDLLRAGRISSGVVAVTRGAVGEDFLGWWSRRTEEPGPERSWLDLAVQQFPSISVVGDPGCNVSYWNLHERPLEQSGERTLAGGQPLRFVHFDGFRADRPYWLSEDATRVRVIDDPVLAELSGAYAEAVRGAGWVPPRRGIADLDRLGNSQRVDHLVKALWDEAIAEGEDFGDPLGVAGADEFVSWMRGRAKRGAGSGVNRYLFAAYLTRPDLQATFPDLDGADGIGLINWAWNHGREVLTELLPRLPGQPAVPAVSHLAVNVIGYLGETLGLAEAARLYVEGLTAAGIPVSTTAVAPDLPVDGDRAAIDRYGSHEYRDMQSTAEPVFNLACLNGDHLAALLQSRGEGVLQGRPTIGQWGWETDVLPASWSAAFPYVDEVWVYSRFMAEKLGRLLPMPVVVVPPAVPTPDLSRAPELTIARDDRFTFLFMLDLFSTLRRKNAIGLVDAFTRAFAPGEGPRLIIKTINARFREQAADELRFHAADRPDVEFIDAYLEPGQKAALLARADCYVSLHRSEGFGLPLAEAMALGTPVIATGYSGNTDFTTPYNSYLVDWSPTHVGPDCEIYPAHGTWAEPDLDHAAELMRRVWERPDEAAARARRGQAEIHRAYAPKVVGEIARARLERLWDHRAESSARSRETGRSLERVERALAFDLRQGVPPVPGGAAGILRRLVLRLILPFSFHEREVDRALLDAVRELRADVERLGSG